MEQSARPVPACERFSGVAEPVLVRRASDQALRRPHGGLRRLLRGVRRRGLRVPRPQRRRQDDDDPHARRARAAGPRDGPDPGPRPGRASSRAAMAHVGCIVESPDLYPYLTGRENLLHFARMLPDGAAARIPELARLVALEERLDDKVSTYSLGMRQRLGIAQALLGAPDLLILDEPANGLDPAGIREIRRLVRSLAEERGIGVFVSSHLLSEVEQMCDRVAIIHRGRDPLDRPRRGAPVALGLRTSRSSRGRRSARPRCSSAFSRGGVERDGRRDDPRGRGAGADMPAAVRALVAAGVEVVGRGAPRFHPGGRLSRGHGRGDGMRCFLPLVENEVLKLWKRRRFRLVLLILVALIGIIVFAQVEGRRRFGSNEGLAHRHAGAGRAHAQLAAAGPAARTRSAAGCSSRSRACSTTSTATSIPRTVSGPALRPRIRERGELPAASPARDRLRGGHRVVGVLRGNDQAPADAADRPPPRARVEARGAPARDRADGARGRDRGVSLRRPRLRISGMGRAGPDGIPA